MVLAARASKAATAAELVTDLTAAKKTLDESRPTAVNLMYLKSSYHVQYS